LLFPPTLVLVLVLVLDLVLVLVFDLDLAGGREFLYELVDDNLGRRP